MKEFDSYDDRNYFFRGHRPGSDENDGEFVLKVHNGTREGYGVRTCQPSATHLLELLSVSCPLRSMCDVTGTDSRPAKVPFLHAQNEAMLFLGERGFVVNKPIPTASDGLLLDFVELPLKNGTIGRHAVRLLTFVKGTLMCDVSRVNCDAAPWSRLYPMHRL